MLMQFFNTVNIFLENTLKKSFLVVAKEDFFKIGGAEEDRTPDLMIANHSLSQLSYSPDICL